MFRLELKALQELERQMAGRSEKDTKVGLHSKSLGRMVLLYPWPKGLHGSKDIRIVLSSDFKYIPVRRIILP